MVDPDVFADEPAEHPVQTAGQLVEVDQYGLQHLPAAEGQELVRHGRGPIRSLPDLEDVAAQGMIRLESVEQQSNVADDHRQHVVEVMGHTPGQVADGFHLLCHLQLLLEHGPGSLGLLAQGDVADRHAAHERSVFGGSGRFQLRPEDPAVVLHHPQLALLRGPGIQDLLEVQVVVVLVIPEDKPGKRSRDQIFSRQTQQVGRGQVGFQDHAGSIDGAVPHRRQIIKSEISRAGGVQLDLDPPQLLVLQFQLDLMHLQVVERPAHLVDRRRDPGDPGRHPHLGQPPQFCGLCGFTVVIGHGVPPLSRSVVVMA
jgi:hypothetical protein